MPDQIILSGISPEDLIGMLRPVMEEVVKASLPKDERLLSPAETCKVFQPRITKATLANWTKQGYLNEHRLGGRVFYRLTEILEKSNTIQKYKK